MASPREATTCWRLEDEDDVLEIMLGGRRPRAAAQDLRDGSAGGRGGGSDRGWARCGTTSTNGAGAGNDGAGGSCSGDMLLRHGHVGRRNASETQRP